MIITETQRTKKLKVGYLYLKRSRKHILAKLVMMMMIWRKWKRRRGNSNSSCRNSDDDSDDDTKKCDDDDDDNDDGNEEHVDTDDIDYTKCFVHDHVTH